MSNLLEVLRTDAQQLLEHELPTINEVRGIVGALAKRLEVSLPHILLANIAPPPETPAAPVATPGTPVIVPEQVPTAAAPLVADQAAAGGGDAAAIEAEIAKLQSQLAAAQLTPEQRIAQLEAQLSAARSQAPQVTSA